MSDGFCVIANGSNKAAINDLSDHQLRWPAQRILVKKNDRIVSEESMLDGLN